ncbi:carboxylate-amine ligase [Streptomyces meridianus]|uniref:Putative glutamate--cysteine ligase 2 n=1 Tax=Streptomyces meridianus TaxID=2938945 RepID=A0ABT0X3Q8_9ACTN|nr:glutamate--cysteine ligase [Streptomyces meridianus]MCM2577180.1 glutamate--cysteine ligase [Streptomyces meridianus]
MDTDSPDLGITFGVEEEFLLVDAASCRPVPLAAEVLDRAARAGPDTAGAGLPGLKHELVTSQVETASAVCTTEAQLHLQLTTARRVLATAAGDAGALLLSTGTPPLPGRVAASEGARFRRIHRLYAGIAADYQVSGCHVHVGVPDPDTAVAVVNHLRPWLPTLLALSVNSPFHGGRDSGYASWRTVEQSRFPGSGVPPVFGSFADYQEDVEARVEAGVLVDPRMSFWLARPSPRFPTVELRVADAAASVEEALLQAVLSRALVRTALTALAAGREAPTVPERVAAAGLWSAARYGLSGPAVHPRTGRQVPGSLLAGELLDLVRPALEETGDGATVREIVSGLLTRGTGAERQRAAVAAGGPQAAARCVAVPLPGRPSRAVASL